MEPGRHPKFSNLRDHLAEVHYVFVGEDAKLVDKAAKHESLHPELWEEEPE